MRSVRRLLRLDTIRKQVFDADIMMAFLITSSGQSSAGTELFMVVEANKLSNKQYVNKHMLLFKLLSNGRSKVSKLVQKQYHSITESQGRAMVQIT